MMKPQVWCFSVLLILMMFSFLFGFTKIRTSLNTAVEVLVVKNFVSALCKINGFYKVALPR